MRLAILLLAALSLLAACGDGPDVDFGGDDIGAERAAVHSRDGALRMGISDDFLYFAIADSVRERARAEMEDSTPSEGIGGAISGMVRGGVTRALSFRARYPIAEIRDIRWENDRMVVEFEDGRTELSENFNMDDRPIEEVFDQDDVETIAAEFQKAKARAGGG